MFIAYLGSYGEVCSTAVAHSLAEATGVEIHVISPDDFASDPHFQRHPTLVGKSININVAIREAATRLEAALDRSRQAETRAQAALKRSNKVLADAQALRDAQAEQVATEAVRKATYALAKAQRSREILETRLAAVNKSMGTEE
jgi:ADP-ribose pyrophosphatase YjhB (NUDIX family)